jgi:Listeria-Bacteroides repeat domain (List_Bact_rpt).
MKKFLTLSLILLCAAAGIFSFTPKFAGAEIRDPDYGQILLLNFKGTISYRYSYGDEYCRTIDSPETTIGDGYIIDRFSFEYDVALNDYEIKIDNGGYNTLLREYDFTGQVHFFVIRKKAAVDYPVKFHTKDGIVTLIKPSGSVLSASEAPNTDKAGYSFQYWTVAGQRLNFPATVTSGLEIYPVYKIIVSFSCGSEEWTEEVDPGESVAEPPEPAKENAVFDCWRKLDGTPYDFSSAVAEPIGLHASFINLYTVIFAGFSGDILKVQSVPYEESAAAPEPPAIEGLVFTGWSASFSCVTSDLFVYARYQTAVFTVIFFNDAAGTDPSTIFPDVEYGAIINYSFPPDDFPDEFKAGYNFARWTYPDGSPLLPDTRVTSDLRFYPVYEKKRFSVRYFDGASLLYESEAEYGDVANLPALPEKTGYKKIGWFIGPALTVPYNALPVRENLDLYAKYGLVYFDVTAEAIGVTNLSVTPASAYYGESVSFSYVVPAGYKVEEIILSYGKTKINLDQNSFEMPASDAVLTVKKCPERYKIKVSDGEDEYEIEYGTPLSALAEPALENKIFLGWFSDQALTVPAAEILTGGEGETVRLYPRFVNSEYSIALSFPGFMETLIFNYGETILAEELFPAEIAHYIFSGWYLEPGGVTPFISSPAADITLYALYTPEKYRITFRYGKKLDKISEELFDYDTGITCALSEEELSYDYGKFSGWDGAFGPAERDAVYTALYEELFDNLYYAGPVLVASVKGVLSAMPENVIPPEKLGFYFSKFVWQRKDGRSQYYEAEYLRILYDITLDSDSGGALAFSGEPYYGNSITLKINFTEGREIDSITCTEGIILTGEGNSRSFLMPAKDIVFYLKTKRAAIPAENASYSLSVVLPEGISAGDASRIASGKSGSAVLSARFADVTPDFWAGLGFGESVKLVKALGVGLTVDGREENFALGSTVVLKAPLPEGYEGYDLKIVWRLPGGEPYYSNASVSDGYILIPASAPAVYAVVAVPVEKGSALDPLDISLISVSSVLLAALAFVVLRKRKIITSKYFK